MRIMPTPHSFQLIFFIAIGLVSNLPFRSGTRDNLVRCGARADNFTTPQAEKQNCRVARTYPPVGLMSDSHPRSLDVWLLKGRGRDSLFKDGDNILSFFFH